MTNLNYNNDTLYRRASDHTYLNYNEVRRSQYAGCYSCKRTFHTSIIAFSEHCIASNPDGTQEPTVFCPYCETDYVIGDASGFPVINKDFLEYMWRCACNSQRSFSSTSESQTDYGP